MWELNYKESWVLKNWCFWTVVLEKTLKSPLDYKEIQPVHLKGDQSWVFIGRTDVEAETPIFWPLDVKSWLIWKDPDVGKDWGQEGKGTTDDWMASLTQLTWVCRDSRGWWCTGRPGVLQFMGSQRVIHYSETELNWTDGNRCYDLSFLSIEFKPTSSFSSFTFIKWLINSSLLSTIRVVSSVYLMLLIFPLAVLTPACASFSQAFHIMDLGWN